MKSYNQPGDEVDDDDDEGTGDRAADGEDPEVNETFMPMALSLFSLLATSSDY